MSESPSLPPSSLPPSLPLPTRKQLRPAAASCNTRRRGLSSHRRHRSTRPQHPGRPHRTGSVPAHTDDHLPRPHLRCWLGVRRGAANAAGMGAGTWWKSLRSSDRGPVLWRLAHCMPAGRALAIRRRRGLATDPADVGTWTRRTATNAAAMRREAVLPTTIVSFTPATTNGFRCPPEFGPVTK